MSSSAFNAGTAGVGRRSESALASEDPEIYAATPMKCSSVGDARGGPGLCERSPALPSPVNEPLHRSPETSGTQGVPWHRTGPPFRCATVGGGVRAGQGPRGGPHLRHRTRQHQCQWLHAVEAPRSGVHGHIATLRRRRLSSAVRNPWSRVLPSVISTVKDAYNIHA